MATVRKRGNSYQIRVSTGYNVAGEQVMVSKTWRPPESLTPKQIEKELKRQMVLFEEECLKQQLASTAIKFEDFVQQWFREYGELTLKTRTLQNYRWLSVRVCKELGHFRLDKITPRHIQKFIVDLTESKREDTGRGSKLSAKTVKLHVSFVSTVFDYALKMQMISANPCRNVTLPKIEQKEREIYTIEEAQQLIDLLLKEESKNLKFVVFYILAIFTGFRRGELLGLEWKDFDFENSVVTVRRTSNCTAEKGVYVDSPKTKNSRRSLKLSPDLMAIVNHFRQQQSAEAERLGSKWEDHDRLFTCWNGEPMYPDTPTHFLRKFCERNGIRYLSNHNFRHLNATVQISAGGIHYTKSLLP
jgi:integrase